MNENNNSNACEPIRRQFFLLFVRFLFATSRKHGQKDFKVAMLFPTQKQSSDCTFLKIDQALKLISDFDPRRYSQIQRDVKKIWVFTVQPYCAEWLDELQTCVIDREYICRADVSPAEVASTIVHEATHARLNRAKIKYSQDIRVRVERICFRSEVAFSKRLPDGEQLVKDAEARLQMPENYWTNAEFQQRRLDVLAELAKNNFAARFIYHVCKRRVERRNALEKKNVE